MPLYTWSVIVIFRFAKAVTKGTLHNFQGDDIFKLWPWEHFDSIRLCHTGCEFWIKHWQTVCHINLTRNIIYKDLWSDLSQAQAGAKGLQVFLGVGLGFSRDSDSGDQSSFENWFDSTSDWPCILREDTITRNKPSNLQHVIRPAISTDTGLSDPGRIDLRQWWRSCSAIWIWCVVVGWIPSFQLGDVETLGKTGDILVSPPARLTHQCCVLSWMRKGYKPRLFTFYSLTLDYGEQYAQRYATRNGTHGKEQPRIGLHRWSTMFWDWPSLQITVMEQK